MGKGWNIHEPYTTYPGSDNYYVICDVCGKKFRKKETVRVTDKFNLQNNLIVCLNDVDKANPQLRPFKAREYRAPKWVRPENIGPEINQTATELPSAPQQLQVFGDTLNPYIDLSWLGPLSCGSSDIIGYVIYQSNPQGGPINILNANTNTPATAYIDNLSPLAGYYTYYVAAINQAGVGPISNPALWPYQIASWSGNYLLYSLTQVLMYDAVTPLLYNVSP